MWVKLVTVFLLFLIIKENFASDVFDENVTKSSTLSNCIFVKNDTVLNCAASKALKVLETMSNKPILQVVPGITLESDRDPSQTTPTVRSLLQIDPKSKPLTILRTLIKGLSELFAGRSLKIKLNEPIQENLSRALVEGRGKVKKLLGPVMVGMGAKMMTGIFGFALVALGLLAAKSLAVSAVAFIISIFAALPSIVPLTSKGLVTPPVGSWSGFGGYGGYGGSVPIPYGPGGSGWTTNTIGGYTNSGQYPYARSISDDNETAD